ncbi:Asp-tRNA(Asn)/Glu-tRNA(Gln) amidotransferase subunit GatC [bacterium]|jgi:aspartyl-tRNA(Asn)/glutamyl-tRNA(Gln) amidotransferase subunit C|nr:Asp-tRNA(Asn)/Glu-tRNA(Gln) amidotransferase subunit GatC [bacterium]MBT6293531.1 Asp-tRNA(Asn)/Glu-tRNA(Gln) amidotransferase subunit GatC [bacterium]
MLDKDLVLKLAVLSKLKLTEDEVLKMQKDLAGIFEYLDILNSVDTQGVEPTYQVSGIEDVLFEDEVIVSKVTPDQLLNCSKFPKVENQIQTNSIL